MRETGWVTLLLFLLLLPVSEVAAVLYFRQQAPTLRDWRRAAAFIRSEFRRGDLIESQPSWTEPLVRHVLGDKMPITVAAHAYSAGFKRQWLISAGDDVETAPNAERPDLHRSFGRLHVWRWPLDTPEVQFDMVQNLMHAEVSLGHIPCRRIRSRLPSAGGLLTGPMMPAERFQCDARRPWLWVGQTITEDMNFRPRRCIWQHPEGEKPVRVRFSNLALGERLVFYGGLYYMHERDGTGAPVFMDVWLGEQRARRFVHRDGQGWRRYALDTSELIGTSRDVTVSVTSPDPQFRTYCWAGYVEKPD